MTAERKERWAKDENAVLAARAALCEAKGAIAEARARQALRKALDGVRSAKAKAAVRPVPMGSGAVCIVPAKQIAATARRLGVDIERVREIEKHAARMRAAAGLLPTETERRQAREAAARWLRGKKKEMRNGG